MVLLDYLANMNEDGRKQHPYSRFIHDRPVKIQNTLPFRREGGVLEDCDIHHTLALDVHVREMQSGTSWLMETNDSGHTEVDARTAYSIIQLEIHTKMCEKFLDGTS